MSARRRWYPFPHLDRREAEIKDGDGERQIPGGNIGMFEHLDIFTQLYLKPAYLGTFKAYEPIKTLRQFVSLLIYISLPSLQILFIDIQHE